MTILSYRDLPPLEYGGEIARKGFDFQDHVAAHYYLMMMTGGDIVEVWCETLDDITVVYKESDEEVFEFIQVKSNDLGSLWSPAKLCERKGSKEGTSIIERLLANDRAPGLVRFGMVTTLGVNSELKVFLLPIEKRSLGDDLFNQFDSVMSFTSNNQNNVRYLLERLKWFQFHSSEALTYQNLIALQKLLEARGFFFMSDQISEIYSKLVGLAFGAAKSPYNNDPTKKRMSKDRLIAWLISESLKMQDPPVVDGLSPMAQKLKEVGLSDYIDEAEEQKRYYLRKRREAKFLETFDNSTVEAEAVSTLNRCKIDLDLGRFDSSIAFLDYCKSELSKIDDKIPETITGINPYLEGFMFFRANRCVFRFRKAE